jgi:hypothetical protein
MILVLALPVFFAAETSVPAASHDLAWTFDNSGTQSYLLDSFEPNDITFGSIGAEDPTLLLHLGSRYQVTVINNTSHPFEVIAKAAVATSDTILLSMKSIEPGSFESDPNVDWTGDGTDTVTFTLTTDLYNAMKADSNEPGYRCGNHSSNMRGDFNICTADIPGDVNRDCKTDFFDFALLADNWIDTDFLDFAPMADNWLDCALDPQEACWD